MQMSRQFTYTVWFISMKHVSEIKWNVGQVIDVDRSRVRAYNSLYAYYSY